jgi:hypothetical protein
VDIIEKDALASTPETPDVEISTRADDIDSFIATPSADRGLLQKVFSWWKSDMKPGIRVVRKEANAPRYMFIITSNSYEDREKETITSAALKAYEDSCYPGEGLYHNDNPLLWWHDDDVVMGRIVAVNYSEPFLIEVAEEAPTLMAKVLWDYAEQNGDQAGASHRFGYHRADKQADGTYTRIFKQESTYLPERGLAANLGTYAGVMKMASAQSDARLDQIFEQVAGIKNASQKIHAKSGDLEKELTAAGISHKALPDMKKPVEADAAAKPEGDPAKDEEKVDAAPNIDKFMTFVNQMYALMMDMVDAQTGQMEQMGEFAKAMKTLTDTRATEHAAEKAHTQSLETQIQALTRRVEIAEKRLALQPRSVTQEKGSAPEAIKAAVDAAQTAQKNGELQHVPGFGDLLPPPQYD